jgi:hypothetical protein
MDLSDPIDREALALFLEIERGDPQRAKPFSDDTRKLAKLLGLTAEWWTGQSPCDRSDKPVHPKGYVAHDDWHRCRAVRNALLATAKSLQAAAE